MTIDCTKKKYIFSTAFSLASIALDLLSCAVSSPQSPTYQCTRNESEATWISPKYKASTHPGSFYWARSKVHNLVYTKHAQLVQQIPFRKKQSFSDLNLSNIQPYHIKMKLLVQIAPIHKHNCTIKSYNAVYRVLYGWSCSHWPNKMQFLNYSYSTNTTCRCK